MGSVEIKPSRRVVISVDDVSPCFFTGVEELVLCLPKGIHLVVGLIPNYKGLYPIDRNLAILEFFNDFVVEWAMHGYTHTVTSGKCSENFEFENLSYEEAKQRIRDGKDLLRAVEVEPANFIPPGFKISKGAMKAIREEFKTTSDLYHIFDLASGLGVKIPCVSLNWGRNELEDYFICYSGMMVAYLAKLRGMDLRLLTHIQSVCTMKHVTKLMTYILQQGYQSVTHRELLTAQPFKATSHTQIIANEPA